MMIKILMMDVVIWWPHARNYLKALMSLNFQSKKVVFFIKNKILYLNII